jgi:hypothetical protein
MGLDWRPIARKGAKHARLPIGISKALRTVDLWEVLEDKFDVDHYTGHDRAIDILIELKRCPAAPQEVVKDCH